MNSNQGAPMGLLSMGYFRKHLPHGYLSSDDQRSCSGEMMGSAVRLVWLLVEAHLLSFSITVLCHYMIKMIVGQVSTHSPPVINQ